MKEINYHTMIQIQIQIQNNFIYLWQLNYFFHSLPHIYRDNGAISDLQHGWQGSTALRNI